MGRQNKIRILSEEEAQKLIENIQFPEYKLLTKLTLSHGLRNSEAISLKRKDFDLENQTFWVIEGKRGKDRQLPIHNDVADELEEYLKEMDDRDYLFPSPVIDSHISSRFFQKLIRKASVNAGLYPESVEKPEDVTIQIPYRERITPHSLRHTFSVRLLRNNTPIQEVSKLLGHDNVEITIESYDFLDIETGRSHMEKVSFA